MWVWCWSREGLTGASNGPVKLYNVDYGTIGTFVYVYIYIEWKAQNGRGQLNNLLYYQPSITSHST